jgi:hypothetical protein
MVLSASLISLHGFACNKQTARKITKIWELQILILAVFQNKRNINLKTGDPVQLCRYAVLYIYLGVPDCKWQEIKDEANMKVTRAEAQTWLALRHLLLDPRCPTHYDINEYRKNQLIKVRIVSEMEWQIQDA